MNLYNNYNNKSKISVNHYSLKWKKSIKSIKKNNNKKYKINTTETKKY